MERASKRVKTVRASNVTTDGDDSGALADFPAFIPFRTGPSLERIPDDVLHEILSYLPTLNDAHVLKLGAHSQFSPPVVPSASLVRTPTLRALSQSSRLLRSRCLEMAWKRVELCGANTSGDVKLYRAVGEATKSGIRVLKACPYLWPMIQTVSIVLVNYWSTRVMRGLADCLTMLPNLTTIQVLYASSKMIPAIQKGFENKQFPSVRRITFPSVAHEIIKSCPNLEEVTCIGICGNLTVESLVEGSCRQVRFLKWTCYASLTPLIGLLSNSLRYISVEMIDSMKQLTNFPLLDTIEIEVYITLGQDQNVPLSEVTAVAVKRASKILQENKSKAEKTVLLTSWGNLQVWDPDSRNFKFDFDMRHLRSEAIKV